VRASARSATVSLSNTCPTLSATSSKTLALGGRNGEGLGMQSNYTSCPLTPSGQVCQ
jgi:hypothetical protein